MKMKFSVACLFFLLFSILDAGDEFIVNTTTDSTQRDPQIVRLSNKIYVIVWNTIYRGDAGDIMLQFFDNNDVKIGAEVKVNQLIKGEQEKLAVASNGNGNLIVTWSSHDGIDSIYDIRARLYHNGVWDDEFLANTTIAYSQTNPSIAMYPDGSFVIAWESWYQDGSDRGVYMRLFNANGVPQSDEILVNTRVTYSQARPSVKYFDDGRIIVVWESWRQDITAESGYGLFAQIFDKSGSKIKSEFRVNAYIDDYQWFGDVETFADSGFVIVWCSWLEDGDKGGIYMQRYGTQAERIGSEIQVNKTAEYYQWLPRIKKLDENKFAVVWSSWLQDGSREGVVARLFDRDGNAVSFEVPVNIYGNSYQWEPAFIKGSARDELLVTWSSWGQIEQDYEVVARRIQPIQPVGHIAEKNFYHSQGASTFSFTVHVIDSTLVKNDQYEIYFTDSLKNRINANIRRLSDDQGIITDFPLDKGENFLYLTDVFDGISVEMHPVFSFNYDFENSYFKNSSGTNIIFGMSEPTLGTPKLAPIDAALIWSKTDTLSDGSLVQPADTVSGYYGDVPVPFKAYNLTDNEPMELFIPENNQLKNNHWDITEKIVFLTPEKYRESQYNTFVQVSSEKPSGTIVYPAPGDTQFVFTQRPQTTDDIFKFNTAHSEILGTGTEKLNIPDKLTLQPNYPNPFNPTTTLKFTIPARGNVSLVIYNVLGQKIAMLVDEVLNAGIYRRIFNAKKFASGTYFAVLQYDQKILVRKILLIK